MQSNQRNRAADGINDSPTDGDGINTEKATRTVTSLIVISYARGKQQANVWLSDGTRLVIGIKNEGNYIPYELISVAVKAAARDTGTADGDAFTARLAEVIEQGGEPRPTAITVER